MSNIRGKNRYNECIHDEYSSERMLVVAKDKQGVLLCQRLNASTLSCKTKLTVYNFSVCTITNSDA